MYLALLLLLLSWGLYLGNAFNTLLAAGFVYYMNTFQIMPGGSVGQYFREGVSKVLRNGPALVLIIFYNRFNL